MGGDGHPGVYDNSEGLGMKVYRRKVFQEGVGENTGTLLVMRAPILNLNLGGIDVSNFGIDVSNFGIK